MEDSDVKKNKKEISKKNFLESLKSAFENLSSFQLGDKKQQKKNLKKNRAPAGRKRRKNRLFTRLFARFSLKDQTLFAKRLSFLVEAGVPLLESLHILRGQMGGRSRKFVFDEIIFDISNGRFLHTSLSRFRGMFGDFAINIIKVGETSGVLASNLSYLSDELKKRHELKKKLIGSLVYPIFITVATLAVSALLTAFIFPKIMPIFRSLAVEIPLSTRILIAVSNYLKDYGIVTALGIVAIIFLTIILHKTVSKIHIFFDRIILVFPVIGKIALNYNMANFTRTLGILLKGGMPVTEALKITGDTTKNLVYRKHAFVTAKRVSAGGKISSSLEEKKRIFPDMACQMIAIGERTGNLSNTLLYLADMYEHEVDDLTKNLSSSIEPVLMIFMGLIVGFVAVSVITPIYEVTQNLNN